jgi:succinyl-CoA synthetase beta subunit
MKVHEFHAKHLLGRFDIPVPLGQAANTPGEAEAVARRMGCGRYAVKSQILAGDRGATGGIAFATTPAEVAKKAGQLLGKRLVTSQTGPAGAVVHQVYVEEAVDSAQNLYAAVALDSAAGRVTLLASPSGGDDIETRAASDPAAIRRMPVKLVGAKPEADYEKLAAEITGSPMLAASLAALLRNLAVALVALDASLIEINPLAVTHQGRLVALDAKMIVDDNALFRRPELAALRHANEAQDTDPAELEAQRYQLNYVGLDGNIGVAVNGAGLALATLDMIVDAGGRPANFMDIRTTASSLDIAHGFTLLLKNSRTKAILVNVHGGGMQRCDTIAEGLGIALRRGGRALPIVIHMAGNNADFARTVLANNGVKYIDAEDMAEAARRVVGVVKQEAA